MDVNPISMKRVYQSIIEQFIDLIKAGKLSVGEKLPPERQLAEMFYVSRASLREALRVMEIIGVVEVRPGGGTFVTDLNIVNFINTIAPLFVKTADMEKDLLEFRKLIEMEAVKLAAEKAAEGKLILLEQAIDLMKKAVENNDVAQEAEADVQFHKAIFALTDNYILIKASECIASILEISVKYSRQKILGNKEISNNLLAQHIEIYEAIRDNEVEKASTLINQHLGYIKEIFQT